MSHPSKTHWFIKLDFGGVYFGLSLILCLWWTDFFFFHIYPEIQFWSVGDISLWGAIYLSLFNHGNSRLMIRVLLPLQFNMKLIEDLDTFAWLSWDLDYRCVPPCPVRVTASPSAMPVVADITHPCLLNGNTGNGRRNGYGRASHKTWQSQANQLFVDSRYILPVHHLNFPF